MIKQKKVPIIDIETFFDESFDLFLYHYTLMYL